MRAVSIDKTKVKTSDQPANGYVDRWSKRFVLGWLDNIHTGCLVINEDDVKEDFNKFARPNATQNIVQKIKNELES